MVEDSLHIGKVNLLGTRGLARSLLAPGLACCVKDIDRRRVRRVSVQDVDGVVELKVTRQPSKLCLQGETHT